MNEPISSAPLSGKRLLFSLVQLVAVTTSVGAAFALLHTLFLPPLGSSGLAEARLPALMLVIALWFCRSGLVARLGSYAVVASLLALLCFQRYLSQTDWLFGHTHGPPQLFVATSFASTIGVLAGIGWLVTRRMAKQVEPAPAPAPLSREWRAARWLGNSAIVVLTLLSASLAVLTIPDLGKKLDDNVEQHLRIGRHSNRELAEGISNTRLPKRPEMAELMANQHDEIARPNRDPRSKDAAPALNDALTDKNERVRQLPSAAWKSQAPFAGDPRNRPAGTVCVALGDDYRWLITETVVRREQWVEGDRKIQAVITQTRRYEHVLGTHEVRIIDPGPRLP